VLKRPIDTVIRSSSIRSEVPVPKPGQKIPPGQNFYVVNEPGRWIEGDYHLVPKIDVIAEDAKVLEMFVRYRRCPLHFDTNGIAEQKVNFVPIIIFPEPQRAAISGIIEKRPEFSEDEVLEAPAEEFAFLYYMTPRGQNVCDTNIEKVELGAGNGLAMNRLFERVYNISGNLAQDMQNFL
jgi:hypothetical protein